MTIILSIIICILEAFCYFYFLTQISSIFSRNKELNKKQKLIIALCSLGLCICLTFIPKTYIPINAIFSFVVLIFINKFVVKSSLLASIILSILNVIFYFLCETLSVVLLISCLGLENASQLMALPNANILVLMLYYTLIIE